MQHFKFRMPFLTKTNSVLIEFWVRIFCFEVTNSKPSWLSKFNGDYSACCWDESGREVVCLFKLTPLCYVTYSILCSGLLSIVQEYHCDSSRSVDTKLLTTISCASKQEKYPWNAWPKSTKTYPWRGVNARSSLLHMAPTQLATFPSSLARIRHSAIFMLQQTDRLVSQLPDEVYQMEKQK